MINATISEILNLVDKYGDSLLIKLNDSCGRYFPSNSYICIHHMRGYLCTVSECKVIDSEIVDETPIYKVSLKEFLPMIEYPFVTEILSDEVPADEGDVSITSATNIEAAVDDDTAVKEALDKLSDDFDYLVSSIEKLERDGVTRSDILQIISNFNNSVQSAIDECINSI